MGNLDSARDGLPITFVMSVANPAAGGTVKLLLPQGGSGFKVPTGYKFHPMILHGESNANLSAGTATLKVSDNNTALVNGPVCAMAVNTYVVADTARIGVEAIPAGHVVGCLLITDGSYAPVTLDWDAMISGLLLPA